MKRKLEWREQEDEEDSEETNDEEESEEEEEPIIQNVLQDLSDGVSASDAKDLLHSMAASKNIVFWTPGGELLRNQQRIPVTSITDLLDYVLLPYNRDILKPRALNSFLEGLAELGINKKWIRNKKVLSDLMEKEDVEDNNEPSDDSDTGDSSGHEEDQNTDDNDSEQQEEGTGEHEINENPCVYCENRDVKVNRIVKCPRCLWHDKLVNFPSSTTCNICEHPFAVNRKTLKSVLTRCNDCKTIRHQSPRSNKEETLDLSSDEEHG